MNRSTYVHSVIMVLVLVLVLLVMIILVVMIILMQYVISPANSLYMSVCMLVDQPWGEASLRMSTAAPIVWLVPVINISCFSLFFLFIQ